MSNLCELCRRVTKGGTTEHHLIPRKCHSNKWFKKNFTREEMRATISLCADCHHALHRLIPEEKRMGRYYNSRERLLANEDVARYVEWVKNRK